MSGPALELRWRIALLAILTLASAGVAFYALQARAIPVAALFLSAASLAAVAAVAFWHLRHAGLAAAVALAPLPGLLAAGVLADPLSMSALVALYGVASLAAALLCGDVVRRKLESRPAFWPGWYAPLAALLVAVLLLGWMFRDARMAGIGAAVEVAAGSASVLLFVPLLASVLPFGEGAVVAANRARERRERWLRLATRTTEPRWGLSLGGVALVLAVLGGFGAQQLLTLNPFLAQPALWGASALAVFLSAMALGRDWREAVAAVLALGAAMLMGLWLWGGAVGHVTGTAFVDIAALAGVVLLPMLALLERGHRYRGDGDEASVARLRAVEDCAAAILFGALGAAAAVAPWLLVHGANGVLALLFLLGGLAGALGMPALATALTVLVPRRRGLDTLYGRG